MTTDPSLLIEVFDLVGIFVFGLSGGLVAVNRGVDIFGVLVLAATTGLGGGVMRDLLIGATPPAALEDWRFIATVGAAGLLVFFFHPAVSRAESSIDVIDALGLSLFAVAGSLKAEDFGLSPVSAVLMGMLTGIGGGVLRDLLSDRLPEIFSGTLYATPAVAGSAVTIGLLHLDWPVHVPQTWAALAGGTLCAGWRLLALRRDWHAPIPRPVSDAWDKADPTVRRPGRGRGWRGRVVGRGGRAVRRSR
ncbi:MAG: trimeric intracellular cation channel family protein [Nocardioides sp.]|uniref:trimeric intracellular cation channel family protein n=1 Tax=Nocardioides sp. TaxID=35761 RepID=UPI0039E2561F